MNIGPENTPRSAGDDPLDHLLNEARWPAATPLTEARLAKHWQAVWSLQRRKRIARRSAVVGVAAAFLVAATFGWRWLNRGEKAVHQPETAKISTPPQVHGKQAPLANDSPSPHTALRPVSSSPAPDTVARLPARKAAQAEDSDVPVLSRRPNRLEEMLLAALMRDGENRGRLSSGGPSPKAAVVVGRRLTEAQASNSPHHPLQQKHPANAAVERLIADPKADPAVIAASLRFAPRENEERLLSVLTNGSLAEQTAAVRLLGEIGNSTAVPLLLETAAEPNLHRVAVGALSRIADFSTISQLARKETSRDLQRVLLAALLGRGDGGALRDYLDYVGSETFGEAALDAAELVSNPPIEQLFSALHGPSELDRLAAARVLGRIDGPTTTERLIVLVEEGPSRQEACVALLTSRGQEAVRFVTSARTNPTLTSLLQAASVLISNNSPLNAPSNHSQPRS